LEPEYGYVRYLVILLIALVVLIAQKDDLAVDQYYFYHIRTSLVPFLTRIEKYEIAKMESIRARAFKSEFWEYFGRGSLRGTADGIEITFIDNNSISLDVRIYKDELTPIIDLVKEKMKKNSA
jgi:hypothetical protein